MVISTQILTNASNLLARVLVDSLQVSSAGRLETNGIHASKQLTTVVAETPGLVQTVVVPTTQGSHTQLIYSIKVDREIQLQPGHIVTVLSCGREPDLVGQEFLVDEVSHNGLSLIKKATVTKLTNVDQQGKVGNHG